MLLYSFFFSCIKRFEIRVSVAVHLVVWFVSVLVLCFCHARIRICYWRNKLSRDMFCQPGFLRLKENYNMRGTEWTGRKVNAQFERGKRFWAKPIVSTEAYDRSVWSSENRSYLRELGGRKNYGSGGRKTANSGESSSSCSFLQLIIPGVTRYL